MSATTYFSPAKLNLFLAITGRRTDGFHDLVSVVAPVAWGDALTVEPADDLTLACDDPAVPVDRSNLVLKAAELFCGATGWSGGARFTLEKRIPIGAGLGGGSSNGATALCALNDLAGRPLAPADLATLAGRLGSDCALFLHGGAVIMRGRGERVERLPESGIARLTGRRVLIFKPGFGIPTPWAYGRLVARAPAGYLPAAEADARLAVWLADAAAPAERLLFNNMEPPAFAKFAALPALLETLRAGFGLAPRMSGSGSACYAFLRHDSPVAEITAAVRSAWGSSTIVSETRLA